MFRQEALDAQHAGGLGEIVLIRPVSFTFLTLLAAAMALLVVGFFLFGSYTKRSTVSGQLVPASGQVKVHAPQAGIVLRKFVQEGQAVRRGERLMVLSSERYERDSLTSKVASLQRELTTLAAQTDSQQRLLALASDAAARYQGLMDKGYISMDQLQQRQAELLGQRQTLQGLERERTSLRQQLTERRNELAGLSARQANQLAETRRQLSAVEQDLAESEAKRTLLVTAPESGIATAVLAEAGQTVDSSRPLLSIVPADTPLQAELYAPSKSIGFIRPGDAVLIRYQAYPYQKFGQYHGKVQSISRASVSYAELSSMVGGVPGLGQDGEQLYRLRVTLDDQAVTAYGQPRPLQSGMLLDADILQDTRRLYEWVLEPLYSLTGKL
ncbi:HlyD family secretion protein [Pseudomonas aeruginosa]|uniref:HlyD family secretion protein n=1 Tax=Pseudomonas aeruginosa TaxID=287 RepID=UPI00071B4E09|nr:HlyD family efflux transporter periplasmic adaptor subunit [Pseudomonas aeruginosa]KSF05950.1 HlyD family secretion protein [Pseudomonas aeruginosa]